MASTEDSPIANKLKRIWFKTPIGEEQATQAVLDPVVGKCGIGNNLLQRASILLTTDDSTCITFSFVRQLL